MVQLIQITRSIPREGRPSRQSNKYCHSNAFYYDNINKFIFLPMKATQRNPENNLQIFRRTIKEFLPSEEIETKEEFVQLVNHLCDMKLLYPSEVQRLMNKINAPEEISYPYTFKKLEQLIMTAFADLQSQQMLEELGNLKHSLRETKGVLAIWKDKGLSQKEKYELESIFERGNIKVREFYELLKKEKEALEKINEQELQMINSLDEWVKMQKVQQPFKDYQEYQTQHQKLIDQMFNKLRVREVHFKQRKNTSKIVKIQVAIGLDSRNDEPVQVTIIPKKTLEFHTLNQQLLTFNAKKQLTLSAHFSRFLGYNSTSDSHCFLYFSEYLEGTNLGDFITNTKFQLEEETPLFKYWACLLYRCFSDVFLMCSYVPQLPVYLKDFDICSGGLRLILKNVRFVESREDSLVEFYEAELLHNLGQLLLGLLKIEPKEWESQTKVKKIQNRNIISCLLNARQGHQNHQEGRSKTLISFFNLQTHPLFESLNLLLGQTIIQNFQAIKSLK